MLKLFRDGRKCIRLSPEFHLDIQCWAMCADSFNGKSAILSSRSTLVDPVVPSISEDVFYVSHGSASISEEFFSCRSGLEIQLDSSRLVPHFKCGMDMDYRYDLPTLQLLCILCVCVFWGPNWSHDNVFVLHKSRNLIRSLRKGKSYSEGSACVIREIFWLPVKYDFRLLLFTFKLPELSALEEEVNFYKSHAMANATRKTRHVQWKKYFVFCEDYALKPLPADAHQMCRFLLYLAQS